MHGLRTKLLIFVVISFLIVALVYSSFLQSYMAFASQLPPRIPKCEVTENPAWVECCQTSTRGPGDIAIHWCTICDNTDPPSNCGERYPEPVIAPPTPTPLAPENALPQGDVQQATPTPPPTGGKSLFGSDVLPSPSISPDDDGVVEQPPITTPQTPQSISPEDSQGDEEDGTDGGGGVEPPGKDLPDTGIREQPDVQQPEQEEPPNEGQDSAGPLT